MTWRDRHLAAASFLAQWWTQEVSGEQPAQFMRILDHYLDAFAHFEAIGAEDRELWRHRIETALADDGGRLTELEAPVRERLERAFRALGSPLEPMSDDALRFGALVGAAEQLGALRPDEPREWAMRIGAKMAPHTTPPPPVDPADERRFRMLTDVQPGELLSVAAGPAERRAGLRVTTVELYENAVSVHWHLVSDDAPASGMRRGPAVGLADDRGTEYCAKASGASLGPRAKDGRTVATGHDDFVPAPPETARRLMVGFADNGISVELPQGHRRTRSSA